MTSSDKTPAKKDKAQTRTDWAEDRTDWAEDRTVLANERTFNSWMGTGLGAVGVAIGLKAVFGAFEPTWAAKAVATLFLAMAVFIFWAAQRNAETSMNRLRTRDAEAMPTKNFTMIAIMMTVATVATGVILLRL